MDLSNGELQVMELLWQGDVLDENGEIQALELSKILKEKYGISKTSAYTFIGVIQNIRLVLLCHAKKLYLASKKKRFKNYLKDLLLICVRHF